MESILENLIALIALSAMEIVLGIDNLVFISILTSKLPIERQSAGRRLGLALALIMRILLLSTIFIISRATEPIVFLSDYFPVDGLQSYFMIEEGPPAGGHGAPAAHAPAADEAEPVKKVLNVHAWNEFNEISWRDIILIAGGLFLLYKSITEIHGEVEGHSEERQVNLRQPSFGNVLFQIALMDIIFSLDSVITAVGMVDVLWIMIAAVILAVAVMILFANQVGNFIAENPTVKMLALNFLLMVGIMLIADGIGTPIPKGYIYFAMGFSLLVEYFNMRMRRAARSGDPTKLESSAGI
ncbi:MAG: TerC family protein [Aureliella sp.]